ncbi:nucleoside diphosphate kinase 6-like [Macrosteles quadrilineatus]|uniref:nucleoside diphosphate kinase 6-like n=1 Tax=Macrosteles quadrilineatus TaxID=74068 RepID=UPI0023E24F21|nr:nucleoside diphosphate kinase 6-like [Macrosteles quadrilineatus]
MLGLLSTNRASLQLTLAILKPHVVKASHALEGIRRIIKDNNFKIVKSCVLKISPQQVESFYGEHKNKFFYNRLVTSMMSGESEVYILAKENAISDWRQLMGPTKVYQAIFTHPDSIRGLYGLTDTRNATHGSDSMDSAAREISVFFPDFNMRRWLIENGGLVNIEGVKSTSHHQITSQNQIGNSTS